MKSVPSWKKRRKTFRGICFQALCRGLSLSKPGCQEEQPPVSSWPRFVAANELPEAEIKVRQNTYRPQRCRAFIFSDISAGIMLLHLSVLFEGIKGLKLKKVTLNRHMKITCLIQTWQNARKQVDSVCFITFSSFFFFILVKTKIIWPCFLKVELSSQWRPVQWRAICIPQVRVRTIKPFPLQSISLQPAIQAAQQINGKCSCTSPCVPGCERERREDWG